MDDYSIGPNKISRLESMNNVFEILSFPGIVLNRLFWWYNVYNLWMIHINNGESGRLKNALETFQQTLIIPAKLKKGSMKGNKQTVQKRKKKERIKRIVWWMNIWAWQAVHKNLYTIALSIHLRTKARYTPTWAYIPMLPGDISTVKVTIVCKNMCLFH